jgi:hypothetical protein
MQKFQNYGQHVLIQHAEMLNKLVFFFLDYEDYG